MTNIHASFVVVDANDMILDFNDGFSSLVGDGIEGKNVADYLSPESADEYAQLKQLRPRGDFEFTGGIRCSDGVYTPEIITSSSLSNSGGNNLRILIFLDSAGLTRDIAGRVLNIFSHALKSPVHSIVLIADLFRRKSALSRFDYYLAQMQEKVQELTSLTDNVLRFSSLYIKSIDVDRRPTNVAKVLRRVLSMAHQRAKAKGLYLREEIPEEVPVVADEGLLNVVFNSLLDNAIKYTTWGGITIHAIDLLTTVRVIFSDTGPGVLEGERDSIFALFFQGARLDMARREGLGLGLYLSRNYVEAMGGSLKYEPIESKDKTGATKLGGSNFIVDLPKTTE